MGVIKMKWACPLGSMYVLRKESNFHLRVHQNASFTVVNFWPDGDLVGIVQTLPKTI